MQDGLPDIAKVVRPDEDIHKLSVIDGRRVRSPRGLDGGGNALLDLGRRLGIHQTYYGSEGPERRWCHSAES